jgi:hypothetical protein
MTAHPQTQSALIVVFPTARVRKRDVPHACEIDIDAVTRAGKCNIVPLRPAEEAKQVRRLLRLRVIREGIVALQAMKSLDSRLCPHSVD